MSLVNSCRRNVSQMRLGFEGYVTCATWLNSNQGSLFIVTLEGKKKKRSLNATILGITNTLNETDHFRD